MFRMTRIVAGILVGGLLLSIPFFRSRAINKGCAGPPLSRGSTARGSRVGMSITAIGYIRTSIAARNPSLTRLKQIEVMKIATPGIAQTNGTT